MSIVADAVGALDQKVDQVSNVSLTVQDQDDDEQRFSDAAIGAESSPRIVELLQITKALSQPPSSDQHLQAVRIKSLLHQSGLADREISEETEEEEAVAGGQAEGEMLAAVQFENDVEWLLLGKAATQTYGLVMQTFLDQIVPLDDDIWYWDEVEHSYTYSCLYTVQSSPLRMWAWTADIYHESVDRFRNLGRHLAWEISTDSETNPDERRGSGAAGSSESARTAVEGTSVVTETWSSTSTVKTAAPKPPLSAKWRQFYSIVRESIAEKYLSDLRRRVLSPVDVCRAEARNKRANLRQVRSVTAAGLGILMAEGFNFEPSQENNKLGWRGALERSVSLMDMLLQNIICARDFDMPAFEDRVFSMVARDPELSVRAYQFDAPAARTRLARRLREVLQQRIPFHVGEFNDFRAATGRPPRLVRYWPAVVTLIASSSTILRILVRRKQDIVNWIRDFGVTARDFWLNWVVEPVRKIIKTIRHDTNSEIALMSRDSLQADRDSLERMVVDFALDKPDISVGASTISESQIAEIRAKVREGDVTPILKAYEKDLRKPFVGAVRGDLVRALLVQIQKTKVDLEVAISGIDALLKSQELVFGFVGLTPGILVSFSVFRYLSTIFGGRRGMRRAQKARRSVRVLRKIHRILSEAAPREQKVLSYQDHGLLLCEVHVLRSLSHGALSSEIEREFVEDLGDLANFKSVDAQLRTVDRLRWAYAELWGR